MKKNILHTAETFQQSKKYLFMEHFEYNGHKFRYIIEFTNHTPLEQIIQIMRADGTWEHIVNAQALGISDGGSVYHGNIEDCRSIVKEICKGFDTFLEKVY